MLVSKSAGGSRLAMGYDARRVIAGVLTCQEGSLNPNHDIELTVHEADSQAGDHTPCDISLAIEAVAYSDRVVNKEERAQQILDEIHKIYPEVKIGVWLDLKPAAWVSN